MPFYDNIVLSGQPSAAQTRLKNAALSIINEHTLYFREFP